MPATSEDMRQAACVALSIKKGETPRSYAEKKGGTALSMLDMTEEQLEEDRKLWTPSNT